MKKIKTKQFMRILILLLFVLVVSISVSADGWYYGDLHQHTGYSSKAGYDGDSDTDSDDCDEEDLNEFGYTIEELREHAEAGLSPSNYWWSITDHSYCLTSSEWNNLVGDAEDNSYPYSDYLFLPSEELTVEEDCASGWDEGLCSGDSAGHLGAHGISSFIESEFPDFPSGWCPEWPDSQSAINTVNSGGGSSIINHPEALAWDWESLGINGGGSCTSGETGIEIWNGPWENEGIHIANNDQAIDLWEDLLLDGEKVYAFGGTDSHDGIDITVYNYAYLEDFTTEGLTDALNSGAVAVSNNGYATLYARTEIDDDWKYMGDNTEVCSGNEVILRLHYNVFNSDCNLRLYKGVIGGSESLEHNFGTISGTSGSPIEHTDYVTNDVYYRAECISGDGDYRVYTNPIWVDVDTVDSDSDGYASACDCNDGDGNIHPPNINENSLGLCDGEDNDCDDIIDENCGECTEDDTRSCGTDVGACSSGTRTCTGGVWGSCVGSVGPSSETCPYDEVDNDCDGLTDENICGGEACYDWDARPDISGAHRDYIDDVDYGPFCANSYNWREADVDDDGYVERYMVIPSGGSVTYVAWGKCRAESGYEVDDFIDFDDVSSYWCLDGSCNERDEEADYTSYQNTYSSPTNTINYPDMYCKVCDTSCYWWGWPGGTLYRYYDDNMNDRQDPGEHTENYLVLECGVDEDCRIDEYCNKPTPSNPTTYYCEDRCGNGVCEIGEICPADTQGTEICNNEDDDCDGLTDEGCDNDNDNYCDDGMEISGTPDTCSSGGNDCDDSNANVNPGETEICNNIDDNCNSNIDEGCDDDNDNYCDDSMSCSGSPSTCTIGCSSLDCDDTNVSINPGISEVCDDEVDNDCDSDIDCSDSDCYSSPSCPSICREVDANLVLQNDVSSSGTCFTIKAHNITLDCNGHTINYSTSGLSGYAINNSEGFKNITITNCTIIEGSNNGTHNYGIYFDKGHSSLIEYSSINTLSDHSYGIVFNTTNNSIVNSTNFITKGSTGITIYSNRAYFNSFIYNTMNTSNYSSRGIWFSNSSDHNNFFHNTVLTYVGNSEGVYSTSSDFNDIVDNYITTYGPGSEGVQFAVGSHNNLVIDNRIKTFSNYTSYGVHIIASRYNDIISNQIEGKGGTSDAVRLYGHAGENLFLNNNFSSGDGSSELILDHSGNSYINYLVYNNSFGEIIWTDTTNGSILKNLTLDVDNSLGLGLERNLFIGHNVTSLNTSAFTYSSIDSSANITLYGLELTSVNEIIEDPDYETSTASISGSNCLGTSCTVIDYTTGTLLFNTTGFSSFAAKE